MTNGGPTSLHLPSKSSFVHDGDVVNRPKFDPMGVEGCRWFGDRIMRPFAAVRKSAAGPQRRWRRSCHFAYGGFRSMQTKDIWAAPASSGVALYLAAKRPLDRSASGLGPWVTIAPPRASAAYATHASMTQTIRTGATVACMLHRGSRINLYPVERPRLVPKSCILVAARLQDGWDSSLVRLIRPTRHPQSHIRPGFGPEAWAKLIQLVKLSSDDCAGWYLPGLDVSPESDHQFARERDDHDAPDPTLEVPDALVIPER
jgi:hypothetical protein